MLRRDESLLRQVVRSRALRRQDEPHVISQPSSPHQGRRQPTSPTLTAPMLAPPIISVKLSNMGALSRSHPNLALNQSSPQQSPEPKSGFTQDLFYCDQSDPNAINEDQGYVSPEYEENNNRSESNNHYESANRAEAEALALRIEQAMDLVKSHLSHAVRTEVSELRSRISRLESLLASLQLENNLLRSHVHPQILQLMPNNANYMIRSCSLTPEPR